MKRMILTVILAVFMLLASFGAYANVTIEMYASPAPNYFGSPNWNGWVTNAITALQSGATSLGDPTTTASAYYTIEAFQTTDIAVTGFKSWKGVAHPDPPFDNEYGQRLFFPWVISSTTGENDIKLSNVGNMDIYWLMNSEEESAFGNADTYRFAAYSNTRIGIMDDGTIINSGPADQLVNRIIYVGYGMAFETSSDTTGEKTDQEQLDDFLAYLDSVQYLRATVSYFDDADNPIAASEFKIFPESSSMPVVDIGVEKNAAWSSGSVIYTINVTNHGPSDATGVEVTDQLPVGTEFVSALASKGTYDENTGVWEIGDLGMNETVTLTLAATLTTTDEITNTATLTNVDQEDINPDNDSSSVAVIVSSLTVGQVYPGSSLGTNQHFLGHAGLGDDVITASAGILKIVPGINWENFVEAAQLEIPYFIKNVVFQKQTPQIGQCADVFPATTISQQGTQNIRTWWPLMYELPGTKYTLNILYGTEDLFNGSYVHNAVWEWQVEANIQNIMDLLTLFHQLPFGLDQVPLISDEVLYIELLDRLNEIQDYIDNEDFVNAGLALAEFEMLVSDACIGTSPTWPNPTGFGTGIANTMENPACCKLLADAEYVGFNLGIFQPNK